MNKSFAQELYNWYRNTLRNPKYRWWIIIGSFLYLLSPIDISPDFIPVIGWIDDGMIITLLVAELSSLLMDRLKAGKERNHPVEEAATADASQSEPVDVDATLIS